MNEENLPWRGIGDGEEKGKEEGKRKEGDEVEEARSLCLPNMGPASGYMELIHTFLCVYFSSCLSTCMGADLGLQSSHSKHDPSEFSLA